jgi:uncharacterized protein YegL
MYQNEATSNSQALVVFLLDVSGTMGKPMGSQTRIQVVKDALKMTIKEMVQRSLKNKDLRPRYRVAMIAYSDEVYDILKGVQPIDVVAKMGIPKLEPLNRTDMTKGLRAVKKLLEQEKKNITKDCPAPLVIHMTDGEYTSQDDPEPVIREIQQIEVADGKVLVENLFVSDELKVSIKDATSWPGYKLGDDLGNSYGNRLLTFSSPLPEIYRTVMMDMGYSIQPNTVMMYPGIKPEFVQMAFVMSTVSGGINASGAKKWEDDPE